MKTWDRLTLSERLDFISGRISSLRHGRLLYDYYYWLVMSREYDGFDFFEILGDGWVIEYDIEDGTYFTEGTIGQVISDGFVTIHGELFLFDSEDNEIDRFRFTIKK